MVKSLHEIFASGIKPRTRFVEFFSGVELDSERWHYADINGSNSGAMSDSVNGGYTITTAGADSNSAMISFNDIRQFTAGGNVSISVWKKDIELSAGLGGLVSVDSAIHPTTQCAVTRNGSTSTKIALLTGDSSTSATDSSLDDDTAFHVYKIECTSPNIQQTIDGVLEIVKTTNRPTTNLQPFFGVQKRTEAGTAVYNLTYCEAYNT